jgi:hypothetical protein
VNLGWEGDEGFVIVRTVYAPPDARGLSQPREERTVLTLAEAAEVKKFLGTYLDKRVEAVKKARESVSSRAEKRRQELMAELAALDELGDRDPSVGRG